MNENKPCNHRRSRRWLLYLIVLAIPISYIAWKTQATKREVFSFQPPEMALAQYTPTDVIGDLGGMKVRIPRHYAEYVEYDGAPEFGEKRKKPVSERTFESRLRSFGMDVRFPDMKGLENAQLREDYRRYNLKPENPWLSIGINAGEIYPSLGERANDGQAKKLWEPSEYWWDNYERLPDYVHGLEAYIVTGFDPKTGKLARESDSTDDIYIHRETPNHVDTYISCGRTSVPGGIARCRMHFGLEPKGKVAINVSFYPALLPKWQLIRQLVRDLFLSFEVKDSSKSDAVKSTVPSPK